MSLLHQVTEKAAQSAQSERGAAARRYFDILARADAPAAGDADAVVECQRVLGRDPRGLAADIASVRRLLARRGGENGLRRLGDALVRARRAYDADRRDGSAPRPDGPFVSRPAIEPGRRPLEEAVWAAERALESARNAIAAGRHDAPAWERAFEGTPLPAKLER